MCNWGSKSFVTQTPLIGYFVARAKRNPIGPFFLRREPPYPFWGCGSSSVFAQAAPAVPDPPLCQSEWPHQHISPCRAGRGPALCHHYGASPHHQDRYSSVQRRFSGDARVGEIPRPKYLAPLLEAPFAQNHSTEWDGSMWNDDYPYLLSLGDGKTLVEIPFSINNDVNFIGGGITAPSFWESLDHRKMLSNRGRLS